jgi:hypothetical protein
VFAISDGALVDLANLVEGTVGEVDPVVANSAAFLAAESPAAMRLKAFHNAASPQLPG